MLVLDTFGWCYDHHILVYFLKLLVDLSDRINGYGGGNSQRRMPPLETHGVPVVHQKPGPLQTIFGLHPNEVTDKNLTCLFLVGDYQCGGFSSVQICKK